MQDQVDANEQFANFLREKRLALGMTFREFSVYLYGSENNAGNLSNIENGKKKITLTNFSFFLNKLDSFFSIEEN